MAPFRCDACILSFLYAGADAGGGEYKLGFDASSGVVTMFSPADAKTRSYSYDENYKAWLSTEDGHQLLEILMRQLTGRCNGYPKF